MRISDWSSDVCSSDLLEGLLADGFRDNSDHPLGRWKAMVRYALQVALLPFASEALLPRINQLFRSHNPARIGHLRILGFTSPSAAWLGAMSGSRGLSEPAPGDDEIGRPSCRERVCQ